MMYRFFPLSLLTQTQVFDSEHLFNTYKYEQTVCQYNNKIIFIV